jgi:type IV pilus assembly protein PilY1
MKHPTTRIFHSALAAASAVLCALAGIASADESEIFVGTGNAVSSQRPNILLIMDTSGSMDEDVVTQVPYDPAAVFDGDDDRDDRIFYSQGSNSSDPPDCNNANSVPAALFKCDAGLQTMAVAGYYIAAQAAQYRANNAGTKRWRNVNGSNTADAWVECRADAGDHGDGVNNTRVWASNTDRPWADTAAEEMGWDTNGAGGSYVFYTGNYINWLNGGGTVVQKRIEIMQIVAKQLIDQLAVSDAVNLGLMRFSNNTTNQCNNSSAEGGMVIQEMGPVAANAATMKTKIDTLDDGSQPDGCTPLSETMYEAYLYMSGGAVDYGVNSRKFPGSGGAEPSIASSRQAGNQALYSSPLLESCQKNFIVLLTDGLPTADNSADTEIEALFGSSCGANGNGRCLEEIAEYMYENDLRPLNAIQNVTTYTIGFGPEVNNSQILQNTASRGGGVFYEASDTATLSSVFTTILNTILDTSTSFTAPAVSVNAFNRTQNLNDLYVTVFSPSETYFWDGNIKKYKLDPTGFIEDANDQPAVEVTTGFFRTTAQDFWSAGVDGDDVTLGGAANLLPDPAARKVYTDLNTAQALTAASNAVETANMAITEATLGLAAAEAPGRVDLINWLRGADVSDTDGDGSTTDPRHSMGDPMNGRPATVIYGGSVGTPDPNDGVVYAVTNEGYLQALDSETGAELWAFMPNQLLARARDMYVNDAISDRVYGLDGNVRVLRNEVNDNGIIEPAAGERVYIYIGMRRGGGDYFGLDVTVRDAPTLLFRIGPNEAGSKLLKNAGQSWSTPSVAKVNIASATQNSLQQVLVFGGGYDTVQDNGPYAVDASGNQIFMVDAVSGNVLWYAGPSTDTAADLKLASMTHGIPADVRIFDITGDGFADRMYAADMGGRVWRFDVHNGQNRTSLVTGGVFASLGNAHLGTHPNTTTRRFYSAPDVAFLSDAGKTWLNIAIGSGYRGHPLNLDTQDRFYSLRDHLPFARLTQAQYDAATVITEADPNLVDITTDIAPTIPAGASGWRLDLRRVAGGWTGEKSLSEARTIESMIQFTTYEPNNASTPSSNSCSPAPGTNRLYTVSAFTGAPVFDRESPEDPPDSTDDRDSELAQSGIAPEVVWLFPSPENPATCVGEECRPDPVCLVGLENCGVGINLAPVRTFWRQTGVN